MTVAQAPPTAKVPDVTGKTGAAAASALGAAGFNVVRDDADRHEPGQERDRDHADPGGGKHRAKQSTVTIVVGQYVPPTTHDDAHDHDDPYDDDDAHDHHDQPHT